jgi:hypothetical protein
MEICQRTAAAAAAIVDNTLTLTCHVMRAIANIQFVLELCDAAWWRRQRRRSIAENLRPGRCLYLSVAAPDMLYAVPAHVDMLCIARPEVIVCDIAPEATQGDALQ